MKKDWLQTIFIILGAMGIYFFMLTLLCTFPVAILHFRVFGGAHVDYWLYLMEPPLNALLTFSLLMIAASVGGLIFLHKRQPK